MLMSGFVGRDQEVVISTKMAGAGEAGDKAVDQAVDKAVDKAGDKAGDKAERQERRG